MNNHIVLMTDICIDLPLGENGKRKKPAEMSDLSKFLFITKRRSSRVKPQETNERETNEQQTNKHRLNERQTNSLETNNQQMNSHGQNEWEMNERETSKLIVILAKEELTGYSENEQNSTDKLIKKTKHDDKTNRDIENKTNRDIENKTNREDRKSVV